MKGYRKLSGDYIEVQDNTPVSATLVPVALRPSPNYVWGSSWQTAPLDPAICWRTKTAAELTADKDAELQAFLNSPGGKALRAIKNVIVAKGVCTNADIITEYRSL